MPTETPADMKEDRPMRMHRSDMLFPVEVKILDHARQWYLQDDTVTTANLQPKTTGSAGIDLITPVDIILAPQQTTTVSLGIQLNILVPGIAGMMLPRSGLGSTLGLVIANTVGLIDNDYQGELKLVAFNRNPHDFNAGIRQKKIRLEAGSRIGQLVFVPFLQPDFKLVTQFSHVTARGEGGFGSTG